MDFYKMYAAENIEKTDAQEEVFKYIKTVFANENGESEFSVDSYIQRVLNKSDIYASQLFATSIFLLKTYIVSNWWDIELTNIFKDNITIHNLIKMSQSLPLCEIPLSSHMKHANLLYLSKLIFIDNQDKFIDFPAFYVWQLRFLLIYQSSVKEEYQHYLKPIFESIVKKFEIDPYFAEINSKFQNESIKIDMNFHDKDIFKQHIAAVFLIEAQNMASLLGDITLCNKISSKLSTLILPYFEPILTGVMGKRTKFQINELPQMLVQIKRFNNDKEKSTLFNMSNPLSETKNILKDVKLSDDTLLEKIHYNASEGMLIQNLNSLERAYVLSLVHNLKLTHPNDPLLSEQIQPYLDLLLSNDACVEWSLKYESLYQRSVLESEHKRKIERATMQLQELVESGRRVSSLADTTTRASNLMAQRMPWFYAAGPSPPLWKIERALAHNYLKMGCTNSALEIFERLNLWEDVVSCYNSLGRREKAEAVIRERLEVGENAELWCSLGDITSDPTCYEKAWLLSGGKSARAQRSLGYYYLRVQKDNKTALSHFQKSLEVVPAQAEVLFTAGCLALMLGGAEESSGEEEGAFGYAYAESCFRKSLMIEPDNFRAWNNLATVQMKRNLFESAYCTLKEALKYNYHGAWQMWENLAYVSARILAIGDVIECLMRLRDILLSRDPVAGGTADSFIDLNDKNEADDDYGVTNHRSGGGGIFNRIVPNMLELVVRTVTDDVPTFPNGTPASKLKPKVEQLFATLTSEVCDNGAVWFLYAEFTLATKDILDPQILQIGEYLLKAHKYYAASHKDWFNHPSQTRTICMYLHKLATFCTQRIIPLKDNEEEKSKLVSSTRLLINNTIHRVKKAKSLIIKAENEIAEDSLLELEADLVTLNDKIAKIQSP